MRTKCEHKKVEVARRLYAMETRYEPAEYTYSARCVNCGEQMEIEDVPEESEREEVSHGW
jgi:hypothetical protein